MSSPVRWQRHAWLRDRNLLQNPDKHFSVLASLKKTEDRKIKKIKGPKMLGAMLKRLKQKAYLPLAFKKWWWQFKQGFGFRVKLWLNEIQTAARYSDCFWNLASLRAKVLLCRKKCWFDWFIFINSNNLQWYYCKIDLCAYTIYY